MPYEVELVAAQLVEELQHPQARQQHQHDQRRPRRRPGCGVELLDLGLIRVRHTSSVPDEVKLEGSMRPRVSPGGRRLRIPDDRWRGADEAARDGKVRTWGPGSWRGGCTRAADPADDAVLIAEANALGLVSDREVREGQVRIRSRLPAGHRVRASIVRGHVVGYAKRPAPARPRPPDSPRSERAMAQLGSLDWSPAAQIPRVQRQLATLWMSALPGSTLDQQAGTMPDLADLAQAWGLALAQLHTERAGPTSDAGPTAVGARARACAVRRTGPGSDGDGGGACAPRRATRRCAVRRGRPTTGGPSRAGSTATCARST